MVVNDPIADMLTRIRNAQVAKHEAVTLPASNTKKAIAKILLAEGYVKAVDYIDDGLQGSIKVTLKYINGKTPVIAGLKRISKPGLRVYARCEELPKVLGGLGIAIISTSKGLMTDKEARKNAIGGEVVTVDSNNLVTVKGPKGTLSQQVNHAITVNQEGNMLHLTRANDSKENRAMHGLYRALVHNMVVGVTDGFSKTLELVGTGYRAAAEGGKKLTINIGFSHPVILDAPETISFETPNANTIVVKGIDKQQVGNLAADIRAIRKPEPYLGKGIKYTGEHIRRKQGKTGKK